MERIYRMRYDYELTLAELFKERFLDELNAWCRACGVKSRIQAYGKGCMPVESLMDVDIPECETWYHKENGEIFPDDKMSGHGYKMVNKFVASGASLGQERRQLRGDHQHALRLQRDARTHQDHG